MSQEKPETAVATVVPPKEESSLPTDARGKLDLSELSPQRRAYIQELRAQVMVQRGIREHCDWLAKTGGLPIQKDDSGRREPMPAGTAAIAIGVGCELGFPMNVALTKVTVINNRPAIYGDVALALIRKRGLVDPKKGGGIRWWFDGKPGADEYTAHVWAKRSDTGEELEQAFSIADAKRAGLWGSRAWTKWGAIRMLRYRALGFLCRDLFSDVLLGVHLAEELYGEEGDSPTPTPPMTTPPEPAAAGVDPLWGDGGPPAEQGPAPAVDGPPAEQDAPDAPAGPPAGPPADTTSGAPPEPQEGSGEATTTVDTSEGPKTPPEGEEGPESAPPAGPAPQAAPPASPPAGRPAEQGDRDWQGRRVLERDKDGTPLVVERRKEEKAPEAPKTEKAPKANGRKKAKPKETKPAEAPVQKAAPPPADDDDDDVAKVRAAIAAAKAKLGKKEPEQKAAPLKDDGKAEQALPFEE